MRPPENPAADFDGAFSVEGGDIRSLTRSELASAYVAALKAARSAGEPRRQRGRSLAWLKDPDLAAILAEFRRRYFEHDYELHAWLECCTR